MLPDSDLLKMDLVLPQQVVGVCESSLGKQKYTTEIPYLVNYCENCADQR